MASEGSGVHDGKHDLAGLAVIYLAQKMELDFDGFGCDLGFNKKRCVIVAKESIVL